MESSLTGVIQSDRGQRGFRIASKNPRGSDGWKGQRSVCGTLMNLVECVKTFTVLFSVNYNIATCLIILEDSRLKFEDFIELVGS